MRDDRRAGVDESAQSAGVVEMHMAGDDIFDRLVRDDFLDLLDQGERALLVERRLDQHDWSRCSIATL